MDMLISDTAWSTAVLEYVIRKDYWNICQVRISTVLPDIYLEIIVSQDVKVSEFLIAVATLKQIVAARKYADYDKASQIVEFLFHQTASASSVLNIPPYSSRRHLELSVYLRFLHILSLIGRENRSEVMYKCQTLFGDITREHIEDAKLQPHLHEHLRHYRMYICSWLSTEHKADLFKASFPGDFEQFLSRINELAQEFLSFLLNIVPPQMRLEALLNNRHKISKLNDPVFALLFDCVPVGILEPTIAHLGKFIQLVKPCSARHPPVPDLLYFPASQLLPVMPKLETENGYGVYKAATPVASGGQSKRLPSAGRATSAVEHTLPTSSNQKQSRFGSRTRRKRGRSGLRNSDVQQQGHSGSSVETTGSEGLLLTLSGESTKSDHEKRSPPLKKAREDKLIMDCCVVLERISPSCLKN